MNRVRWLEARWPISIRALASRLRARSFSLDGSDGFLLDRVRDGFIEGRFIEKVPLQDIVRDPFGNETSFEHITYREVEFSFSDSFPQVELRKFSRTIRTLINRIGDATDFATTVSPVNVDVFGWAERIRVSCPDNFRIDLAQASEVVIEESVVAKIVMSSPNDVRSSFERFTKGRQHRVDRLQIKCAQAGGLCSFQIAADATARSAAALPSELLSTIREALLQRSVR